MGKKIKPSKQLVADVKKAVARHGYQHGIAFLSDAPVAPGTPNTCPRGTKRTRVEWDEDGKHKVAYVCMPV